MNNNTEYLNEVIALMVEDACDLYINCAVNIMHIKAGKRRLKNAKKTIAECLDSMTEVTLFFCSEYGEQLTGFDGKTVMERLNKRARKVFESAEDKNPHYRFANKRACYRGE